MSLRRTILAWLLALASVSFGATIPKGTKVHVRFDKFISSLDARLGDSFDAELTREIGAKEGKIPAGARVHAIVTEVQRASSDGSVPGQVAVALDWIEMKDVRYVFATREVVKRGTPVAGKDPGEARNRRREGSIAIGDTIGGIAHPNPGNIPSSDSGGPQVKMEKRSVDGTFGPGIEYTFVTVTDSKALEPTKGPPKKPESSELLSPKARE
jgi:hypothetical protein